MEAQRTIDRLGSVVKDLLTFADWICEEFSKAMDASDHIRLRTLYDVRGKFYEILCESMGDIIKKQEDE